MAVGSNSLGLLFKIDVDSGDAAKQIQDMINSLSQAQRQLVSKELTGSLQALNEELKNNKSLTDEQKEAIKAAIGEIQKYKTAIDQTSAAYKEHEAATKQATAQFNQLRSGFESVVSGNVLSGLGQIARAVGPAVVGVGALALGILAATKAIEGMISAANEIGTDSKEDFDKLNASVKAAGGSLNEADRAISQGLNKSFDTLHGAVTDLFAQLLGVAGPALKNLILDISGLIEDMKPLVRSIAVEIRNDLASLSAFINVIRIMKGILDQDLITGALVLDTSFIATLYEKAFDQALKAADEVGTATFKAVKGKKDLTQAQLEENQAARELALTREQSAKAEAEIARQLKAGEITVEEALAGRLAIEQNIRNAEDALLDAQKKRIEEDVKGQRRRTDALEENANQRTIIETKSAAAQAALHAKAADELKKLNDDLINEAIELDKKERDLITARNEFLFKSQIETRKAIADATEVEVRPEGDGAGERIIQNIHDQAEALDPLTKAWRDLKFEINDALVNSADLFTNFTDLAITGLKGLTDALQTTLETFILTGQLGAQAFRTLTAAMLSALVVEAFHQVLKMHAKAVEEGGYAAADLAAGDYAGFLLHSLAAEHFAHAAIAWGVIGGGAAAAAIGIGAAGGLGGGTKGAAAGGGFGGETKPGEITINQGAGSPLGIQLQQLNALNHISNTLSTATPGDVVTRGSEQNPVAIGQANNEASRRDGSISREFLQISGLRTA